MNDFSGSMKEKLLTEALEKRIRDLSHRTLKEYFNIFSEEFMRYEVNKVPGFHPMVYTFNESFTFLQFVTGMMQKFTETVAISNSMTRDVMRDPMEMLKIFSDPRFQQFVKEFKAKTNLDIN